MATTVLHKEAFAAKTTTQEESSFHKKVVDYWDGRSRTYSNSVKDELQDFHYQAWSHALLEKIAPLARQKNTTVRVLDLGCGPGFFEIILSQYGFYVDAIDSSQAMLAQASENVAQSGNPELVNFHLGDVTELPFADATYDVVLSRNVTWLMRDPIKAYAEWHRALKPGGKLLIFDANWYTYLVDEALNASRLRDQADSSILEWSERSFATNDQERRCEALALELPLTYKHRPTWDAETLPQLGFDNVCTDEAFSRQVWNEGEQVFYATSPLFAIEATKIGLTCA